MLDPLVALGLASSVVQFIDFGMKLAVDGYELYESGSLHQHDILEQVTIDLTEITASLTVKPQYSSGKPSTNEKALDKLAISCKELGDRLVSELQMLRPTKVKNTSESIRKSIRSSWKKQKIQDLEKQLEKLQKQLTIRLVAILNDKQSNVISILNKIQEGSNEAMVSSKIDQLRVELLTAVTQAKQHPAVAETKQFSTNETLFSSIAPKCVSLAEEGNRVALSKKVLNSLYFKYIKVRQAEVKEAEAKTFEWIFQDAGSKTKVETTFAKWLESGKGIYWISGKAGSGKSTLMKFLCNHPHTQDSLNRWAGQQKLVTASYYFWVAGNRMQKSQEGLLQSLLFQTLHQCPELIPMVYDSRWKDTDPFSSAEPWSRQELFAAFSLLATVDVHSTKFCFFVDGLDEYDGEHIDLVRILQGFSESPSIKICASSRPWNVFEAAFGENVDQTIRLQDLTKNDIRIYVQNTLEKDPRFAKHAEEDDRYIRLVEDIVERAQGVFLWVYLVVRSLLRGLTDDNDMALLQRRLDQLPPDLEQYFTKMLDTIEDVYQEQTAKIFLMVVQATTPLYALALTYLDKEEEDPDYSINAPIERTSEAEVISASEKMKTHLNGYCKDLLDVNINDDEWVKYRRYRINFLHRTVRDFLMSKEVDILLRSRISPDFNANASLSRVFLAMIKNPLLFTGSHQGTPTYGETLLSQMIYHASGAEIETFAPDTRALDELHRVLSLYAVPGSSAPFYGPYIGILMDYDNAKFISMVALGCHLYVAEKEAAARHATIRGHKSLLKRIRKALSHSLAADL